MSSQVLPHRYGNGSLMGVPDQLLSCDTSCDLPTPDSFPFSLYEHKTVSTNKEMGVASLDQFPFSLNTTGLEDSSFDLWGATTAPPTLPSPPPLSSSFLPDCTGQYVDLDLLCETGFIVQRNNPSPQVSPPSPLSAPLSPREQEIRDIMSSLSDPAPFVSNGYTPLSSSPLCSEPVTSPAPTLTQYLTSSVTPPTSIEPLSPPTSIEPLSPPYIPSPDALPSPDAPPSPIKPVTKRRQTTRRKIPATKKKERKKEQNKTAALRYRQKKKGESRLIEERQEELEAVNQQLKAEVQGLEGEIGYLKQLWADVCRARQSNHTPTTISCQH